MKNIIAVAFVAIGFLAHAKSEICPGYIVSLSGDTTKVKIDVTIQLLGSEPDIEFMQYKVKVIDKKGKKADYKADELSAFGFTHKNVKHIYRSTKTPWMGAYPKTFLKVVQDGACVVYTYYHLNDRGSNYQDVIKTRNQEDPYLMSGGLRTLRNGGQELGDYLADCPTVVQKIKKKEVKKDAISVANAYNMFCGDSGGSVDDNAEPEGE